MRIIAPRPPWTGLGRKIESSLRKALFDFDMVKEAPKIGVALSGGKDSLTLLILLKAISGRGFPPFEVSAFHVSGEFSCGAGVNEGFLRSLCDELEVPFFVAQSTQRLETLECYSCSRERRRLLFESAKEKGVHTLAFGHHKDDLAQTMLMNLFHKAEFAGLLPKIYMHDYQVTIIRPLIYVAEKEIKSFAGQHQFARIMCRCPVGQHSMRKKTEELLQEIEVLFPNARENIAKAALLYGSQKAATP